MNQIDLKNRVAIVTGGFGLTSLIVQRLFDIKCTKNENEDGSVKSYHCIPRCRNCIYPIPNENIESAIETIHKAGLRIGLVVDQEEKLLGTVTDGDIRRALLSHKDMSLSVVEIMNSNPITASPDHDRLKIIKLMKSKYLRSQKIMKF
mgnify:CR=1 FL=1